MPDKATNKRQKRQPKRQMPKGYVQSALLQLNQAIQMLHSRLADVEVIVEWVFTTHEDEVMAFLEKRKADLEAEALAKQEQTVDDSDTHRERKSEGTGTSVSKE